MLVCNRTKGVYYFYSKKITEAEYNKIREIIRNRPTAPEGYGYGLTDDLRWEMYELPPEDTDEELSDSEALDIIVNGGSGNA